MGGCFLAGGGRVCFLTTLSLTTGGEKNERLVVPTHIPPRMNPNRQVRALCCPPPSSGRTCGVPASYLSSQQGAGEAIAVKKELRKAAPTCKVRRTP